MQFRNALKKIRYGDDHLKECWPQAENLEQNDQFYCSLGLSNWLRGQGGLHQDFPKSNFEIVSKRGE